jgi:hypothetical protein
MNRPRFADRGKTLAIGLSLCALSACTTNGDGESPAATVRDSAGVEIVENRDVGWSEGERWTVDSTPLLTIGIEEGDPQLEFYRLLDVRQLADGRIVAMNAGTNELRYFSPDGAYLCSSGQKGAGPGDFENMGWLQLLGGDTVLVRSQSGADRLSVVGPDGAFVRTISVPRVEDAQFAMPTGLLTRNVLVMQTGRSYSIGVPSGTYRDSAVLVLLNPEGQEVGRIGPLPRSEASVVATDNSISVTSRLFGRFLALGFGDGRLYTGTNDRYEIAEYDTTARLRRLIRLDRQQTPVTADIVAHAESSWLATSGPGAARARTQQHLDQMKIPSTLPSYSRMLVDVDSNLWVLRYAYQETASTWDAFNRQGHLLGSITLPDGFRPHMITASSILGVVTGDLGVQRVQLLRLIKSGGSGAGSARAKGSTSESEPPPTIYRRCGT